MSGEPHQVIIYRSPAEYQLYESGLLFPIMCGCASLFLVFLIANQLQLIALRKGLFGKKNYRSNPNNTVSMIFGILSFILTIYCMSV